MHFDLWRMPRAPLLSRRRVRSVSHDPAGGRFGAKGLSVKRGRHVAWDRASMIPLSLCRSSGSRRRDSHAAAAQGSSARPTRTEPPGSIQVVEFSRLFLRLQGRQPELLAPQPAEADIAFIGIVEIVQAIEDVDARVHERRAILAADQNDA